MSGGRFRVLKENPSQVEPRFLIGGKLYPLREKKMLRKNADSGVVEFIRRKLNFKDRVSERSSESGGVDAKGGGEEPVYLSNLLREYKGKLYVPEQVFGKELSEEEEFHRGLEELPRLGFEDFMKAVKSDKVKLLTSKEVVGAPSGNWPRDFVVDLKEIPCIKSLHRTKWVLKLSADEFQTVLWEYMVHRMK